jgi:hypothetical protein
MVLWLNPIFLFQVEEPVPLDRIRLSVEDDDHVDIRIFSRAHQNVLKPAVSRAPREIDAPFGAIEPLKVIFWDSLEIGPKIKGGLFVVTYSLHGLPKGGSK